MNSPTKKALGILTLFCAVLIAAVNTDFFSTMPTTSQWVGVAVVVLLGVGLIVYARLRPGTSDQLIEWDVLGGVMCGVGLSHLIRTEMTVADYILGGVFLVAGIVVLLRSLKCKKSH